MHGVVSRFLVKFGDAVFIGLAHHALHVGAELDRRAGNGSAALVHANDAVGGVGVGSGGIDVCDLHASDSRHEGLAAAQAAAVTRRCVCCLGGSACVRSGAVKQILDCHLITVDLRALDRGAEDPAVAVDKVAEGEAADRKEIIEVVRALDGDIGRARHPGLCQAHLHPPDPYL